MADLIRRNWQALGKLLELIILSGILFWMFCQVRDLPTEYVQRAQYERDQATLSHTLDRMDDKLDGIKDYLLNGKRHK
jgi:hypothetical protein